MSVVVDRKQLIPLIDDYRRYLEENNQGKNGNLLSNTSENYKREIPVKAAAVLRSDTWQETQIGEGFIGDCVIKAVQRNDNLVGRFQVSNFANRVKENHAVAERIAYDLFRDHKDPECFERICEYFGRKYDLVAYLFFISDPNKYLPLRSQIFDSIFKKLDINLRLSGRCSWENYQDFLNVVADVRDAMAEQFPEAEVDLLDAHSFLWTQKEKGAENNAEEESNKEDLPDSVLSDEKGHVLHKEYGKGVITKVTAESIYVVFSEKKKRIFPNPEAFEKGYLHRC